MMSYEICGHGWISCILLLARWSCAVSGGFLVLNGGMMDASDKAAFGKDIAINPD